MKKSLSTWVLGALLILGCSDKTPKLTIEPPEPIYKHKNNGAVLSYKQKVDILFVVDDSGSMSSHQTTLSRNMELFTQEIMKSKSLDYHIGVISTSVTPSSSRVGANGRLNYTRGNPKWVENSTPNGNKVLSQNVMLGTSGEGYERVFDPVVMALSEPIMSKDNFGFYRPDAFLVLMIVTDAEDQSVNYPVADQFYHFLKGLKKGSAEKIMAYGAIIPTNDTMRCPRDDSATPLRLESFFKLANGAYYNLCDTQYGSKLAKIGLDLVTRIGRYIMLDARPKLETIQVFFGSQELFPDPKAGWSYDPELNAVVMGTEVVWSKQPAGTVVEVYFDPVDVPTQQP